MVNAEIIPSTRVSAPIRGSLMHVASPDRQFRPDVEGLRALAVVLVVLFHATRTTVTGGYIGVDVFFVISGFLITGLLINERARHGSTSLVNFYARRVRRILPAATVTLIVTVLASYQWLGFIRAGRIALDGQWTALFAANLHFALDRTQYLNSLEPPSPLQHYWSLAVEEQFYLVWPAVFWTVAALGYRTRLRTNLAIVLVCIAIASFSWSAIQTSRDANWAFFSPLTRAWELAVGGLLAVAAPSLRCAPGRLGPWIAWLGVIAITASALLFDEQTPFPGVAGALPVAGAALVIAGGTIRPGRGAELVLGTRPFQWIGQLSYSLYLWHWPVLLIARQEEGQDLPPPVTLLLVVVVFALSLITFYSVENPVRRARVLISHAKISLLLGVCLIAASVVVCGWQIQAHSGRGSSYTLSPAIALPFSH